ncbi:MAG: FHA domain-containing protein [Lachnospiraceae bacterium]|jgi:hypothetical protein|nr:FHA domain-containing protein [Lachnospiraceae bacterium]
MNLKRCQNGHFYDADKFTACPHCSQPEENPQAHNPTIGINNAVGGAVTTPVQGDVISPVRIPEPNILNMPPSQSQPISIKDSVSNLATTPDTRADDEDSKTIYFKEDKGVDPVVGWLVCISGNYFGESFKLKTGRNFIGRAQGMDIVLAKDRSVSRDRHAIVVYVPKSRDFLAQPGDSRSLFYLNENVVLTAVKLKRGDILSLGDTKLMFIPCCGADFGWDELEAEG